MLIRVSLSTQTLILLDDEGKALRRYPVSTATEGAGEAEGSHQTPRGRHIIRAKIGAGSPLYTVFSGRRPTGERWSPELEATHMERDWILTRILWLSGCEPGKNRLGSVDTMRRYIYIHGCSETAPLGEPHSHGCIRMKNRDIVELFDLTPIYTAVEIDAD
ncbi:L,D-transpeptidase [Betaproteobacteria bacterium]|nr:L,D-transpeptidase [Betaproteobacteria bacterium]GHU46466.1 L,D-transpeptidase [Betaproteobacteria bacterium]